MNRRRLLTLLGLPSVAALGGFGYTQARANPYYQGPVSDHFDGRRFFAPGRPGEKTFGEFLRWRWEGGRAQWPMSFPSPFRDRPPERVAGLRVALIGHASFLYQVAGLNILIDPVFSDRASPFTFAGPLRTNPPGIAFEDLPPIDAVLITHNHYDHMDTATLERLRQRFSPRFIAPLGNDVVVRKEAPEVLVETGDWGHEFRLNDNVSAHLVPAYHWSARWLGDRRMALWCAFVLTTPKGALYHIGDTGYGDGAIFREVRQRFGAPALLSIPIGAYEPRWFMAPQHINPEEAVRIFRETGAAQALGHHWGTFQLTNEPIEQPLNDLVAAREAAGMAPETFRAMRPGEVFEAVPAA